MYCEKHHLFQKQDKVILAVSGGADSVYLVHIMKELAKEWMLSLVMVHINHGIRGAEADRDEVFCRQLAQEYDIPFRAYHGDIPSLAKEKHMSEEEAARWYRYQCLEEYRAQLGFDKIAVAHHQNDQAETVLFQILRGSSLRGAGGIRPKRGVIVRPLLDLGRQEIEEGLMDCGQQWCEDSTNQEIVYSRNQIRHEILPKIEQKIVPGATQHLAKLAEQLQEVFSYLEKETQNAWNEIIKKQNDGLEMQAKQFCSLHPVLQKELILQMIEEVSGSRKDITRTHIEACCRLAAGETGKRIALPYGIHMGKDYELVWMRQETKNNIHSITDKKSLPSDRNEGFCWNLTEQNGKEYVLENFRKEKIHVCLEKLSIRADEEAKRKEVRKNSCTKWFDYAKINSTLEFRHPKQGDYFLIQGGKKKKLGRFLIDRKVAKEDREKLWVLAMGGHILWIPELDRVSTGFYVEEHTVSVLQARYQKESNV